MVNTERTDLRISKVNGERTDSRPRRYPAPPTRPGCGVHCERADLRISRVNVARTDSRPRRRSDPRAHPGCKGQTLVPPGCNGRGHVVPNRQSRCSRGVRQNLLVVTRCHGNLADFVFSIVALHRTHENLVPKSSSCSRRAAFSVDLYSLDKRLVEPPHRMELTIFCEAFITNSEL
jgi:hypothetical protein